MVDVTPEEFVKAAKEQGQDITWEQARDYLEYCKRVAESLRTASLGDTDTPGWLDIANISLLEKQGALGPQMTQRLVVKLVLLRQALDRAETRCASLEHVLEDQHGQP